MKFRYTWQGSACPLDEKKAQDQTSPALDIGLLKACACGRLDIVVFGDRLKHTFGALVNCPCGKVVNPMFRGILDGQGG